MWSSRTTLNVVVSVLGLFSVVAKGAEIALIPVSASGPHTIVGNEIILPSGGQTVTLEIRAADWDPEKLRAYQARIDLNGFFSGAAGTALPLGFGRPFLDIFCQTDNDCPEDFPFCSFAPFGFCTGPDFDPAAGAFIDTSRTDYVFHGLQDFLGIDFILYRYGSTILNPQQSVEFLPPSKYLGTLILVVSDDAAGTFTIGFIGFPDSLLANVEAFLIVPLALTPALITVSPPVCGNGVCELGEDEMNCPTDCAEEAIPTVSEWGMIVMTLLLVTAAKIYFGWRRAA